MALATDQSGRYDRWWRRYLDRWGARSYRDCNERRRSYPRGEPSMDFMTGAVSGRIVSALTAGMLVLAACGPASQPSSPTSAPAATTSSSSGAGATQPTSSAANPAAPAPTIAPTLGTAAAGGQPKQGGRIILGEFADAKTLNPVLVTDVPSDVVVSRIYTGLLNVDAKTGDVTPNLAEKYDFSADGKTLSFTLRDGIKWSDGSAMTGD